MVYLTSTYLSLAPCALNAARLRQWTHNLQSYRLYLHVKARREAAVIQALKEIRCASTLAKFRDIPTLKGRAEVINHPEATDKNLANVLALLISLINSQNLDEGPQLVAAVSSFMDHVMTSATNDPIRTIAELKEVYSYYVMLVRGGKLPANSDSNFSFLTRSDYTQTHAALASLLALSNRLYGTITIDGSPFFCKLVVALLQTYRVLSVNSAANYSTITGPSTATYSQDELDKELQAAIKALPFTPSDFQEYLRFHVNRFSYRVSEKGGPNGPATRSATADARALVADKPSFTAFCEFCEAIGLRNVMGTASVMALTDTSMGSSRVGNPVTGRIHEIAELGGKTRLVAIVDYWTQSALAPLHATIGSCLKLIDADGVYNQDKAAKAVKAWSSDSNAQLFSYDLTAATDRLPVAVQEAILSVYLGSSSAAKAWRVLLTGREYAKPDGDTVTYAVGQPMGALSSFAMFDLTHHLLIQVAAARAKFPLPFNEYVIIGDDVCLANADVAAEYTKLMKSLGVSINLSKSVVHDDGLIPGGEIAKRLFVGGIELSSIPVKLFAKLARFGKLAVTVQEFLLGRGAIKGNRSFINFIAGAVDSESLLTLLKLNAAPAGVVGLQNSVGAVVPTMTVSHWSPEVVLKDTDVIDAYTFTLISEQLKRLEALIRQTAMVEELIIKNTMTPDAIAQAASEGNETLLKLLSILAKTGSFDRRHPMQAAAFDEARRVGKVLAGLRAGTTSLSSVARLGLLDSLRNSIWSSTFGSEEESAQVTYSVFLSALNNLERITLLSGSNIKGQSIPRTLEFTIPILALSRSFSVYWKLGGGVHVNMVRTRINSDTKENAAKVDSLVTGLTVLRGHPARKPSST